MGSGNMASAIIAGMLQSGQQEMALKVYDLNGNHYQTLAAQGVETCSSPDGLAAVDCLILAVKPQNMSDALDALRGKLDRKAVVVSIAAGITEPYIQKKLGFDAKVVLVMPNTPLLLGRGATAMSKGRQTSEQEFSFVQSLFRLSGIVEVISTDKMNEVIALNGSSPAFIYLFAKGFLQFAQHNGIEAGTALRLFSASLEGAAKMMTDSGKTVDELITMVSSPGGTTLAGLDAFYQEHFCDTVEKACNACTKRAYELSQT